MDSHIPHPIRVFISVFVVEIVVICLCILVGKIHGDVFRLFSEDGLATWVSFIQLLILSLLSSAILFLRCRTTGRIVVHLFWALAAFGFVILALDEKLMWHERFDRFVHEFFAIEETAVTDRIDDVIIGIYGLIGILAIYLWRREVGQYVQVNLLLTLGFILLFTTVMLDILVNRYDIIPAFLGEGSLAQRLYRWGPVLEESIKLTAEGVFISAFYSFFYYSYLAKKQEISRLLSNFSL